MKKKEIEKLTNQVLKRLGTIVFKFLSGILIMCIAGVSLVSNLIIAGNPIDLGFLQFVAVMFTFLLWVFIFGVGIMWVATSGEN